MLKDRLLEALKISQKTNQPTEENAKGKAKSQKQKRLSSEEFLKAYDNIWKEGPKTTYQNPESWRRAGDT